LLDCDGCGNLEWDWPTAERTHGAKMEDQDTCHDFNIRTVLGEKAENFGEKKVAMPVVYNYSNILICPRWKINRWYIPNESRPTDNSGTMENKRLAAKLRDPKAYYKE